MPIIGDRESDDSGMDAQLVYWLRHVLNADTPAPEQMTTRQEDAVGKCLTDEMVSRCEIVLALSMLESYQITAMVLYYGWSLPIEAIAHTIGRTEQDVAALIASGKAAMKSRIWDNRHNVDNSAKV